MIMATDRFRASVQYGDWEGTASADNADQRDLRNLLIEKKLMDGDREFLVGATLWIGENHGGEVQAPFLHAILIEGTEYDRIEPRLKQRGDPIPTRNVDLELTLEEFLGLFKRVSVVLTARGLRLTDREYQWNG
jgi:hypothetical protein